jgi:hypothetical protein
MISYFYLREFRTANYMYRYLEIFYWVISSFYLKMTIRFFVWLNTFQSYTIVVSRQRSPYCLHWIRKSTSSYKRIIKKQKTSGSTLGQTKSTTISINSIRIMRIFHYKGVSKSVNSNMPCDEQYLLWGKINPHRI